MKEEKLEAAIKQIRMRENWNAICAFFESTKADPRLNINWNYFRCQLSEGYTLDEAIAFATKNNKLLPEELDAIKKLQSLCFGCTTDQLIAFIDVYA